MVFSSRFLMFLCNILCLISGSTKTIYSTNSTHSRFLWGDSWFGLRPHRNLELVIELLNSLASSWSILRDFQALFLKQFLQTLYFQGLFKSPWKWSSFHGVQGPVLGTWKRFPENMPWSKDIFFTSFKRDIHAENIHENIEPYHS